MKNSKTIIGPDEITKWNQCYNEYCDVNQHDSITIELASLRQLIRALVRMYHFLRRENYDMNHVLMK